MFCVIGIMLIFVSNEPICFLAKIIQKSEILSKSRKYD